MGTRSTIFVLDDNDTPILSVYGQWDGDPKGIGQDIYDILAGMKIVNGLHGGYVSNGVHEMGAKLIAYLKEKNPTGNIYLHNVPQTEKNGQRLQGEELDKTLSVYGEEYSYIIRVDNKPSPNDDIFERRNAGINIQVWNGRCLYNGAVEGMKERFSLVEPIRLDKRWQTDRDFCLKMVKRDGTNLKYVAEPDSEMCIEAVKSSILMFPYVSKLYSSSVLSENRLMTDEDYKNLSMEVVRKNGFLLKNVYYGSVTYDMCMAAVKENGEVIGDAVSILIRKNDVDKDDLMKKVDNLVSEAIKETPFAIRHIPEELIDEKLIAMCKELHPDKVVEMEEFEEETTVVKP